MSKDDGIEVEQTLPGRPVAIGKSLRHELRTPLNQIIGYSELLQEEAREAGHADIVPDLQKIETAGRTLLRLVEQIPDLPGAFDRPVLGPTRREPSTGHRLVPEAPPPSPPEGQPLPRSILVVDDNEGNRDMLARRLQRSGYTTHVAGDGPEALALIEAQPFDLVLLDVMMPGMSGLEVLEVVRQTHSVAALPVVMATARDQSGDMVEAFLKGANDYVTKPLDMPVVLARIGTQLELKAAREQVERLNRRIAEAQDQIAKLAESSAQAVAHLDAWSTQVAAQVARAVGVDEIAVWLKDRQELRPVTRTGTRAPTAEELDRLGNTGKYLERSDDVVISVTGLSGQLFGALVITGAHQRWGDTERRLVESFARQLGGAMELRKMQQDLAEAEARRQATRQEMLDRGIKLLKICPQCRRCYAHDVDTCDADGHELHSPQVLPLRVAERYELTRLLGEGGMGLVFRARDLRLEREVALKLIKAEFFNHQEMRQRFTREAQLVARIHHPGVVAVFDYGDLEDGSLYLVMELLLGCELGQVLRRWGPGQPRQVAHLLREASAGLAAAHHVGLIHRDIKPENVFLVHGDGGFHVKILDFGVAKELDRDTHLTSAGILVGTPRYMSPEQAQSARLDARSDLYSLAAVAFRALTGRDIACEGSFLKLLMEIISTEPPLVSSIVTGAPAEVDAAFQLALAKEPARRPDDVEQWVASFVDALERWESSAAGWPTEAGWLHLLDGAGPELTLTADVPPTPAEDEEITQI
jgi:eukaryotic-like serine/threonine-protein kinase